MTANYFPFLTKAYHFLGNRNTILKKTQKNHTSNPNNRLSLSAYFPVGRVADRKYSVIHCNNP